MKNINMTLVSKHLFFKNFLTFFVVIITAFIIFSQNVLSVQAATIIPFTNVSIDPNSPSNAHSKDTGDINGDGLDDLLVAGTGGELYWYEYPTWSKNTITTSGGGWSTDIEVGDINNDGLNDVVISDWYQNNQLVWFENPGPVGSWTMHIIGSPRAHDIEIGDLDNDGDIDIVTRQQGSAGNTIHLWRQDTPNSWSQRVVNTTFGEGLHIGDLDNDGDLDIMARNRWYENDGDILNGSWTEYIFTNNWVNSETINYMGDINGDGLQDIVLTPSEPAGGSYKIAWYEAPIDPKTPGWTEHIVDSPVETVVHGLGVADMDGDGDADIVTSEMHQGGGPDEVNVYHNDDGIGTVWVKQVVDTAGSHNIRVTDIGNDGDMDIYGVNWDGSNLRLWENQLNPTLSLDQWTYIEVDNSRDAQYFGLAMQDMTSDGYGDIVSGKYFYRNPGSDMTGVWQRITFPTNVDALLALDVDDDLFGDAIAMDSTGKVFWLEALDSQANSWSVLEIGDLGSADHGISSQGYTLGQVIAGGKPEIVINITNKLSYFEVPANPDLGNWPLTVVSTSVYPEGVALGDVDGDGDLDISGTSDSVQVAWWENPGDGTANWNSYTMGSLPSNYADRFYSVDLNGDSRLDLAVSAANGSANGVYWFEAPADPKLGVWIRNTVVNQDTTNSMDVADMDGDGDIDIISGEHRGTKKVAIWENDGIGNFVEHVVDTGKESHLGTRVVDLDGDNDLDIVSIAWDNFQYLHVWRNDATVSSTPPDTTPPVRSNGAPTGTLPSGTTQTTISLSTDESAICKYDTVAGTTYSLMPNTFTTTGSTSHGTLVNGLLDGQAYTYYVKCEDIVGNNNPDDFNISFSIAVPDLTPPTIPANVQVISVSSSTINLSWDASTDPESGINNYIVYRDSVNVGQPTSTTFTDNGLQPETTYSYEISAVNGVLLESALSTPPVQGTTSVSSSNPPNIAFYTLDEGSGITANDSSGSNNHGTLVNGPIWTTGQVGTNALDFDGVNDYVDAGTFDVAGSAISIALWMNSDNLSSCNTTYNDCRLISKATGTSEQDHYWMVSTIKSGSNTTLRFRLKTGGTTTTLIAPNGNLSNNQWYHVTATYDGSTMRLYQDGVEIGQANKTGQLSTNATVPVNVARNPGGYGYFDGTIDDMRVYDRALNESEILELAGQTPPPDTIPPVRSNGAPTGTLPSGTTQTTISLSTDEGATCKYDTTAGTTYSLMPNTFTTTGSTSHGTLVNGLLDGQAYTYYVKCEDIVGNNNPDDFTISFSIAVPDLTPPTVSITSPLNGATVLGTISIDADATDNIGVVGVQFQLDGVDLGTEDLTSPYSVNWDTTTVADDNYGLTAVARDVAGNTATSTVVNVIVDNVPPPDPTPPTVPTNVQVTSVTTSTVSLSWDTSVDPESGINNYIVYRDSVNVGQPTSTTFTDNGLQSDTTYSYEISAVNGALLESATSTPPTLGTTSILPPNTPNVAYWNFDEGAGTTANDSSGSNNHGTLVNGPVWVAGQVGSSALDFDGANDYIDAGTFDMAGSEISIALWMNSDNLSSCNTTYSDCRLVSKATGTSEQDHYWMVSTFKSGSNTTLRFRLKAGGTTKTLVAPAGNLLNNQWYHVTATYDGSDMKLYQDGVEVGSTGKSGSLSTNSGVPVNVARNPGGYGYFDGTLDDVRIYDRALSESEILEFQ
jgi:fibronectin type 3 domain-containing protein